MQFKPVFTLLLMATPEGVEPPTLRSEVSILPLIPK
jgi:hypothetical protein